MSHDIVIEGLTYISSKRAAQIAGYSQDYIGQLARGGKIAAKRVAGLWYVLEESLLGHKTVSDAYVPTPPPSESRPVINESDSSLVTLDGSTYVSAARAAKLTSYHQDYIGQLARSGKIVSRQVGNRWYIDIHALKAHKRQKDALLGAVQANSVGLLVKEIRQEEKAVEMSQPELHYSYVPDSGPLLPPLPGAKELTEHMPHPLSHLAEEIPTIEEHKIPIRVLKTRVREIEQPVQSIKSEIPRKKSVRISGKAIFYNSFTVAVITVIIFVGFNIQLFEPAKNLIASVQVPSSSVLKNREIRVPEGLKHLFTADLDYKRQ